MSAKKPPKKKPAKPQKKAKNPLHIERVGKREPRGFDAVRRASTSLTVGRPSSYDPGYCDIAFKLCLLGLTDADVADVIGVAESTLNLWKIEHPEFSESMRRGRDKADAEIAHSLFHRARGYSHEAVKIMQYEGTPIEVPYVQHYPPDTAAASLWLRNRQSKRWRDKTDVEHAGPNGAPIPMNASVNVTLSPADVLLEMLKLKPGEVVPR